MIDANLVLSNPDTSVVTNETGYAKFSNGIVSCQGEMPITLQFGAISSECKNASFQSVFINVKYLNLTQVLAVNQTKISSRNFLLNFAVFNATSKISNAGMISSTLVCARFDLSSSCLIVYFLFAAIRQFLQTEMIATIFSNTIK